MTYFIWIILVMVISRLWKVLFWGFKKNSVGKAGWMWNLLDQLKDNFMHISVLGQLCFPIHCRFKPGSGSIMFPMTCLQSYWQSLCIFSSSRFYKEILHTQYIYMMGMTHHQKQITTSVGPCCTDDLKLKAKCVKARETQDGSPILIWSKNT